MSGRGHQRERDRVNWYRANGWFAMRAPASLGEVDVIAMKAGERVRFEELKSTSRGGPFQAFGPKDRAELSEMAKLAGADAYLVHWPPRGKPNAIPESEWPA